MTQVSTEIGLLYPVSPLQLAASGTPKTMDATAEKAAVMGHLFIEGRGMGKVLNAAGGGAIAFRAGTVTFAAVGPASTLDVGLQNLSATPSGIKPEPDGTFDVKGTLTSGVDTIASNSWKTAVMTTGTKTMSHGDLIGIVLDLTARNGADSVQWATISSTSINRPASNVYVSGAWGGGAQFDLPLAYITFDDGTLGVLYSADYPAFATLASESFVDATNPDERGLLFQVPWNCKAEGARIYCHSAGVATADYEFNIYADPLGTPSLLASIPVEGGQLSNFNAAINILFPSKVDLSRNTDYCMTAKATGAGSITLSGDVLPDTDLRTFLSGGVTLAKVTRNNGCGAFTAESPAVTLYNMKLLLNDFEDSAGGSSGGGHFSAFIS